MRLDTDDAPPDESALIHVFGNEYRVRRLCYLDREGPTLAPAISEYLGVVPTTTRTHCRRCREVGLVTKEREQGNTVWRLTPAGEQAVEWVARPLEELVDGLTGEKPRKN